MNPTIAKQLSIMEADLKRRSPRTTSYYISISRKFLSESGDFHRPGMLKFMDDIDWCDNSLRTVYYVLKHLCKALEKKFPLDEGDLPPPPDEESMYTPTMSLDNINKVIAHWKRFPGDYLTSLAFLSTIYGLRSIEMTTVEIGRNSVLVYVAKRKRVVTREHPVPEELMKYLSGYEPMSEMTVKYAFWKVCRRAGVKRQYKENWHSVRRCLVTACLDAGVNKVMLKRFLRWARDRRDMADTYYHKDFADVNEEMFKVHPFLKLWG